MARLQSVSATVILITNIPTPYRLPLFNEIHRQLEKIGIRFRVVFAALGYDRRKWQIDMADCSFEWETLPTGRLPTKDKEHALFTYPGLNKVLNSAPGALIIVGGFSLAASKIWLRSYFRKTKYLIWSGAIAQKKRRDSRLTRLQRRLLVSRASSFISYGTQAKNYLVGLGADVAKVTIAINTVDVDYFRIETEKLRNGQATNLHGAPKRFLYVGNLEQGKRVDLLIEAVNRLRTKRDDFVLEIIGTGSLESLLKNLAKDNNAVEFHGYLQRSDVAKRLAEASCFVFPSEYDVWGLVLVEAMAAGLPCLASIHCGATSDLIRDDQTGFALDFENIDNVVSRLEWVLDHPTESAEMGARAADFIRNEVTLSQSAAGFVKAIAPLMTAIPATKVGEVSASAVPQAR